MAPNPPAERTWGGSTLTARRANRREALLATALDLVGEGGCGGVTVRSVCRRAGLTDRYFYENFPNRDDLLCAVYDQVADEARNALARAVREHPETPAARARAAVEAFVSLVLDDPRKGRLLLLEPLAHPVLGARSLLLMPSFTEVVRDQLPGDLDEAGQQMASLAVVGALANLFAAWLGGSLRVSRHRLVEQSVELVLNAYLMCSTGR